MLMLGRLFSHCKQAHRDSSLADDGAAKAGKRGPQSGVGDAVETAVERLALCRIERPRHGLWRPVQKLRRTLDEGEADHRAIAEIAVDALEQDRLAVLDLERQRRCDAQPQGPIPALAARKGELQRPAMPGKL